MKKPIQYASFIGLTLAALSAGAQDQSYQVEVGVQYAQAVDHSQFFSRDSVLAASYYLKPVMMNLDQPFAELEFLQRASNIGLGVSKKSYQDESISRSSYNPKYLFGTYYYNDFIFTAADRSYSGSLNIIKPGVGLQNSSIKEPVLSLGYLVRPDTSVSLMFDRYSETNNAYTSTLGNVASSSSSILSRGLQSHTVTSLGNQYSATLDLNLGQIKYNNNDGSNQTNQTNRVMGAQARFYPRNSFYLMGGFQTEVGGNSVYTGKTYSLGSGSLLTPRTTVSFQVNHFLSAEASRAYSGTSSSINLSYRF